MLGLARAILRLDITHVQPLHHAVGRSIAAVATGINNIRLQLLKAVAHQFPCHLGHIPLTAIRRQQNPADLCFVFANDLNTAVTNRRAVSQPPTA